MTPEQKDKVLSEVFNFLNRKPVNYDTLRLAEIMSQNVLSELLKSGEIGSMPDVECNFTVVGQRLNRNREFVDVIDETSITINFIDPSTGKII